MEEALRRGGEGRAVKSKLDDERVQMHWKEDRSYGYRHGDHDEATPAVR